jgi:serine/threonine protein kinase
MIPYPPGDAEMPYCPTCAMVCGEGVSRCPADGSELVQGDPLLGQILGDRYRILERIGTGGMGTVYRAEHVILRKRLAIKVLRPELSMDEGLVRRFQQEAIAASQVGQENIVDVTDFGRTPRGALYFVMEELDGVNLHQVLSEGGPLPLERALLILSQLCRALTAAHGRGIVHRDLKPENVILLRRADGSDFVKVVDFGISKTGRERHRLTRAGMIMGTPEYMAPEQGAAATVDQRADIYALGVLAYEMLTGTLPFQGETPMATLLAHQTRAPEPPGRHRPDLPADLEALVLRALEKRPDARQQTMLEVAADLTCVLVAHGLPPVFDRIPTIPPQPAALAGLTDLFPLAPARRPTTRGGTVALDPSGRASGNEPAASRRRAGRILVGSVLGLAAVVAGAAVAVWAVAGRPPSTVRARVGTPAKIPTAPRPATTGQQPLTRPPDRDERGVPLVAIPVPSPTGQPELAASEAPSRGVPPAGKPRPAARPARDRAAGRGLGGSHQKGENPRVKLDDLKPDPF